MIDFVVSIVGAILLLPIYLLLVIIIKITSPGPVLFKQKRVGVNYSFFMIYKFRTMRIDTPKDMPTHMLENPECYITSIGKILRKTSLDELPQLFNIIKGDMAIVGPRPALWNQDDLMKLRAQNGASKIRPGLTGLAQISGRDELEIEVKANLDGKYASDIRFLEDIRIFFATFSSVLKEDGIKEGKN